MAYCTASDVATLNKARQMGVGQNPTASDVTGYCTMIAGAIDAVLLSRGYQVPVNTASYPEVAGLLQWVNSTGAWHMMEDAAPNSVNVDRAKAAYDAAMKMLSDSKLVLDIPMNTARAEARGPWATLTPSGEHYDPMFAAGDGSDESNVCNAPRNPYFTRNMRF